MPLPARPGRALQVAGPTCPSLTRASARVMSPPRRLRPPVGQGPAALAGTRDPEALGCELRAPSFCDAAASFGHASAKSCSVRRAELARSLPFSTTARRCGGRSACPRPQRDPSAFRRGGTCGRRAARSSPFLSKASTYLGEHLDCQVPIEPHQHVARELETCGEISGSTVNSSGRQSRPTGVHRQR
jgi:hypothetical protein